MQKVKCGLPLVGIGTFKVKNEVTVFKTLDVALASGYRLIDTASVYRNENDIGEALKALYKKHSLKRKDVFITSKLAPKDQGTGKCKSACLESLSVLQTDYLDLYLIHWPGVQKIKPENPLNSELRKQSWQDMEDMFEQGILKSIGVSNYTVRHLEELLDYCRIKPAVLQTEYHPHLVQSDLVDFCKKHDIQFQAYSSLGTTTDDNKLLTDPTVVEIAKQYSKTEAQILLKWALQQDICIIPKSTNPQHIKDNINIFDFEISQHDMQKLSSLKHDVHYCWNPEKVV